MWYRRVKSLCSRGFPAPMNAKSIISKISNPFSTREWPGVDLHIELKDPHRQYMPGDKVEGVVVIVVQKPLHITHTTIKLHGFVRVSKNAYTPGEFPCDLEQPEAGEGRRGGDQSGRRYANIFGDEHALCGEGRLNRGKYVLGFETQFPWNLPSSIDVGSPPCLPKKKKKKKKKFQGLTTAGSSSNEAPSVIC
jgi:arrestin-related trafficking adapter 9